MVMTRTGHACDSVADASYFARRTILESKAQVACISRKTNDDRYDSGFQIFAVAA